MSDLSVSGVGSLKDNCLPQIMQVDFINDNLFISVISYKYLTCLQGRSPLWGHP